MYVHMFGYLVNKLEIWLVYHSPIEKKKKYTKIAIHFTNIVCSYSMHHILMIGIIIVLLRVERSNLLRTNLFYRI